MALSQMQVFNEYIMPATLETLDQMVQLFNEASAGAIRLTTEGFDGDFLQESFFQSLAGARRRVDRYASNTDASVTDLTELKRSAVKVAGGFGPVRFEPSQLTWLQRPTAEGVEVASRYFAEYMMQDQLNTAILALVAALENTAAVKYDASALSPARGITQKALNSSHAKFGDKSGSLVAQVMTGSMAHKLIGQNLDNDQRLFSSTNVTVLDILGKAVIVTDAPALFEEGSGGAADKEKVLSLVDGAAVVFDGSDVISNVETSNGKQRIETTLQVDYSFGLSIKGFTWDETSGGKSPTDAEIGTGTNWDKVMTSDKDLAGVIAIGDAGMDN
jgi:hypothetical protein